MMALPSNPKSQNPNVRIIPPFTRERGSGRSPVSERTSSIALCQPSGLFASRIARFCSSVVQARAPPVGGIFRAARDRDLAVPAGPDWLDEIKHDGYRLIVQREGKRVRLLTRRGYDWSDRYPLITQAAIAPAE